MHASGTIGSGFESRSGREMFCPTCSIGIINRNGVNTSNCPSDRDVKWRASTRSVQVHVIDRTTETKLHLSGPFFKTMSLRVMVEYDRAVVIRERKNE